MMLYIAVDGDDIGQKISACYFYDDTEKLKKINDLVQNKINNIADFLRLEGFTIVFCAADGVTAFIEYICRDQIHIYQNIKDIAGTDLTFSVGLGKTLREAYIALLAAKSNGKAQILNYADIK